MNLALRRLVAPVAAVVTIGLIAAGGPHAQRAAAAGPPTVISAPLPTVADDFDVLAATGDWIWAVLPKDARDDATSLSKDGGRTWQTVATMPEVRNVTAGAGRLAYFGGDDGLGEPYFFYPTDLDNGDWGELWSVAAMGTKAMLATNLRLVRSNKANVRVTFAALPRQAAKPVHRYAFTSDSAYLVRTTTTSGSADYASVIDVASATSIGRITLPRTSQHQVSGSALYSLTGTRNGLQVCRQPLPSGPAGCTIVVPGDQRKSAATLTQFGPNSIVRVGDNAAPLLVKAATVTAVQLPAGTTSWRHDGKGDANRALLRTVDSAGHPHHLRVNPNGTTTEYLTVRQVPAEVESLALGPSAVYGSHLDEQNNDVNWQRPLTGGVLGAVRGDLGVVTHVSGARRVVQPPSGVSDGVQSYLYDGDRRSWAVDEVWTLSGPYLLTGTQVRRVTGATLATTRPEAIFGSLVAEHIARPKGQKGYWLAVRDLADHAAKPRRVQLLTSGSAYSRISMYGDWVGTSLDTDWVRVVNSRTSTVLRQRGELIELGDGFALLSNGDDYRLSIWTFATNTITRLEKGSSSLLYGLYGNRVAYTDTKRLLVRTVSSAGRSAPRLLGAVTSGRATRTSPWKAAIDLTKPVLEGTLVIRDSSGRVVRTLATPASATGSLRGLSWSGRDTAGRTMKGSYRWELIAAAADGSGNAVSVTGLGPAGGAIRVG